VITTTSALGEVGDLYSKRKEDVAFRQEWAERIGLGFDLVHVGPQKRGCDEIRKEDVNLWTLVPNQQVRNP